MNKKYLSYSAEQLLEDRDFIAWIRFKTNDKGWLELINQSPDFSSRVDEAAKILPLLEDSHELLSKQEVQVMWSQIYKYNENNKRGFKVRNLRMMLQYAAAILFLLIGGGVSSVYFLNRSTEYQFAESSLTRGSSIPVLRLSDGSEIDLKKDDSTIALRKEGIEINNDSIVRLDDQLGEQKSMRMNEVIVPYGKRSRLTLVDGTKVCLNAGSRLAFPQKFDREKREVFLEGEAYFEVVENKLQPFIVNTASINIEVLGTKFNVSAYRSDEFSQTVLLDGRVNVSDQRGLFAKKISMHPRQKVTFSKDEKSMTLEDEPMPEFYMAWSEGWYPFSNASFEEVLKRVERYYNVTFQYDHAVVSEALPMSGKLDLKESINEVMKVLSRVAKVDYEIADDGRILVFKKLNM